MSRNCFWDGYSRLASQLGAHFLPVVLSNSSDVLQKLMLPSFCPSCAGDFLWSPATGSEQAGSIHRMIIIMDSTFILTFFLV